MNQATNLRRYHLGIWSRTCVLYAGSLTIMAPTWLAERIYILSHISLSFKSITVDIEPIMTRESVWEEPITNAPCSSFCVTFISWNVKSLKMYVFSIFVVFSSCCSCCSPPADTSRLPDLIRTSPVYIPSEIRSMGQYQRDIKKNIAKGTTDPGVDCFDQ